jgi:polysaccharide biosynthesis transport protein
LGDNSTETTATGEFLAQMKLSDYVEIARRRKWYIILSALGLFVAATVLAYRLPSIYRAETVILVNSAEVPDKYVPTIITADIAARLTTLQQQVLSPTRLKKMVETEGLYPDPTGKRSEEEIIASVQKSIIVEVVNQAGKMGAFRIAFSGRNRAEVAPIANLLAKMFIESNLQAREKQTEGTAEFLNSQLQETKRQLDEKDSQLRAIKSQNVMDLPEAKPYHLEALASLRAQVQGIQDKVSADLRDRAMLQSMLSSGGGTAPTVDVDNGDGTAGPSSPYESEIAKLESKLADLRTRYGPGHPDVKKAQSELNRLKTKAASEPQDARPTAVDQKPAIQSVQTHRNPVLEAQIEKLDEEIKDQQKLLPPLQERIDFHTSKLQQVPVFEQQIAHIQQDYDILKTQYSQLLGQEKAAEISHALEVRQKGEHFEVLDAAITPDKPALPNRILISIAGLFGGLVLGMALAAAVELNDETVRTEGEAIRIFGKPVLSGVPWILSVQEKYRSKWRAAGLLAGTLAGSAVLGFLLSIVSERFL